MSQPFEQIELSIDNCKRTKLTSKGAEFKEVKELSLNKIYVPKTEKDRPNNIVRPDLDRKNVVNLEYSFKSTGIDYYQMLPVVKFIEGGTIVNGKILFYELAAGFHRWHALRNIGQLNWLFSVYEFSDEEAKINFQKHENDHPPHKGHTSDGLANLLSWKVQNNKIDNTEEAFKEELKDLKCHHAMKGSAISKAIKSNGTWRDIKTYDAHDIKDFIEQSDNYSENESPYTYYGQKDIERNMFGWSILEGYEPDIVMNAMKAYHEEGLESYFLGHTKLPTKKRDLVTKRKDIEDRVNNIGKYILDIAKYHDENNKFPWQIIRFLPQDNKNGEDKFIKPEEVSRQKNLTKGP